MALPIKETPHLKGKAARKFIRDMMKEKPVPKEDYLRAKETYDKCVKAWGKDPLSFL